MTNNRPTRSGWLFLGKVSATVSVIVAAVAVFAPQPAEAQRPVTDRVLVVPFANARHEPRLQWLGEASAVLLEDQFRARGLGAISRDERVRAFEDLHLPLTASLTHATSWPRAFPATRSPRRFS